MDKQKHPISIATGWNDNEKRFDLHLLVGNFLDRAEAEKYGAIVKELLSEHADGKFWRVQ